MIKAILRERQGFFIYNYFMPYFLVLESINIGNLGGLNVNKTKTHPINMLLLYYAKKQYKV